MADRIHDDLKEIKSSLRTIGIDVTSIKVETGRHHERLKMINRRIDTADEKVKELRFDVDDAAKESSNIRIWILSAFIGALLSLLGVLFGIIKWLLEKA